MTDPTRPLRLKTSTLAYPLLFVLAIWMVLWAELTYVFSLNDWGILPRTLIGLRGIVFGPFIHSGVMHALSNSLPLFLLAVALFYFYEGIAWKIMLYGVLITGFLTWLIGRGNSTHIGASGVVYLLAGFLIFKGIFSKNYRLIALSLIVVFVYGGLVWGMFPGKPHISWEGHLSGFFSGLLLALIFRKYKIAPYQSADSGTHKISAREAEFLSHFDEDGNFVPSSEMEPEKTDSNTLGAEITYNYKPRPSSKKTTAKPSKPERD